MSSDPIEVVDEIVTLARDAADVIRVVIEAAMRDGDVSTVDALAKVLPEPAVLRARDRALIESQRARAAEVLRRQ